jgi:hypothetical protein
MEHTVNARHKYKHINNYFCNRLNTSFKRQKLSNFKEATNFIISMKHKLST